MPNAIDRTIAKLPFIKQLFGDEQIQGINKKYKIFADASVTKEKQVQRISIINQMDHWMEQVSNGGGISNVSYHQLMYNASSDDKKRRLIDYRVMAQYPEVESALREICNEMFERDDQGETIKMVLREDYNDEITSIIEKEFQKFIMLFKFNEKGWKYTWDFITEGELFFENIVSSKKPHLGILGVTRIAAERIDPLYYDLDNELIDSYILRSKMPDQYPYQWGKFIHQSSFGGNNQHQLMFMNDKQITYFANDMWESEGKKYRVPILANAHRPYRQLSLIEDATIIYMLVRAPERLVFNIDTGNMPAPQTERYLKRLMAQFWSKKTIGNDGRVENTYDPVSMLENYWFPKSANGQGSTVESVGGGDASPDNLEILNFFVQKLYKSLHVPLSRLNSDTAFSDGENITREELRFAEFIITVQKLWAAALKNAFIVHLKLKGKKTIDTAKKLGMNDFGTAIDSRDKKSEANVRLSINSVFRDNFNVAAWDNYDTLCDQVTDKLEKYIQECSDKRDVFIHQLEVIDEELANLESSVVVEKDESVKGIFENKREQLLEEAEEIAEEIEILDEDVKQLQEDNTSWWDQYKLKEEDIDVKFNEPTQFFALREQQIFQLRYDNYNNMSQNDMVSNTFAQKIYLGWKDHQILANLEFLIKDAAQRWQLAQIEANGPDFREKALEEMKGAVEGSGDMGGLGGGGLGGGGSAGPALPSPGGGGDTSLPAFGEPPAGGEAETPEAGGEKGSSEEPPAAPKAESYNINKNPILEKSQKDYVLESLMKYHTIMNRETVLEQSHIKEAMIGYTNLLSKYKLLT